MTKITLEDFIKVYALTDRMSLLHQFYHEHIELYRTFEENIHQQKVINRLSRKIQRLKNRIKSLELEINLYRDLGLVEPTLKEGSDNNED